MSGLFRGYAMQAHSRADRLRQALTPIGALPGAGMPATLPADDPTAWQTAFQQWITIHCIFRDGCAGGIGCLHLHFAEWCIQNSDVCPCTRPTFELLLSCEGFDLSDDLVRALILKVDSGAGRAYFA
jgi:hypothetical protein